MTDLPQIRRDFKSTVVVEIKSENKDLLGFIYKGICGQVQDAVEDMQDLSLWEDDRKITDVSLTSGVLERKSLFSQERQIRMNCLSISVGINAPCCGKEFFEALIELTVNDELKHELRKLAVEYDEDQIGKHSFSKFECNI